MISGLPPSRRPAPDTPIAMDPYYRFDAAHPRLIRITGGNRVYNSGNVITTFYSATLAYHPQDTADNSKPADWDPTEVTGPKNADSPGGWSALEASGNDSVPTDGSVVVLAWPSPSQDYWIFHYPRKILARVGAEQTSALTRTITAATNASPIAITTSTAHKFETGQSVTIASVGGNTAANGTWIITKTSSTAFTLNGSTGSGAYTSGGTATGESVWYEWTEVEPKDRVIGGHNFEDKLGGLRGIEHTGPLVQNPLFEVNQKPLMEGDIVEVFAYPVRQDTSGAGGYLRERPEPVVSELVHADGSSTSTKQRVKWYGVVGGTFTLTVTNSSGTAATTLALGYTDNATTIKSAIEALSNITTVNVTGDGSNFTVEFVDDYNHVVPIVVNYAEPTVMDGDGIFTDTPYFCVSPPPNGFAWTDTKSADYTASPWEAVVIYGAHTIKLPDWATSPVNCEVLISNLAAGSANYATLTVLTVGDKINGVTNFSGLMIDAGRNSGSDNNAGGDWRAIRSANSDVGWSCSRYLKSGGS